MNTRARRPVPTAETSRAAAARAHQDVARGRPRLTAEDAYVQAMLVDMARQFLTEADNCIHTPRLPSPYRRALAPSPHGQARAKVVYSALETEDPAADNTPLQRAASWLREVWRRLRHGAPGYRPPTHPPRCP